MSISQFRRIVIAEPEPVDTSVPTIEPGMHLPGISKQFLLAGKCLFRVTNTETNEQMLFKVRGRESEWPKNSEQRSIAYMLNVHAPGGISGMKYPDPGKYAFRYIGLINADGTVMTTQRSEYTPDDKEYTVGAWATYAVIHEQPIPQKYTIMHVNRCGRCAVALVTDNESQSGICNACHDVTSQPVKGRPSQPGSC